MLSSIQIRNRIYSGMIRQEAIPARLNSEDLQKIMDKQWQKQLKIEGGYFDLTVSEFSIITYDALPEIGPDKRLEPRTRPIRWIMDEPIPYVRLMPDEYVLFRTREIFSVPPDISVRLDRKSTLHRCGADVLFAPTHCSYQGSLTLGLKVLSNLPLVIRYGARLLCCSFHEINGEETTQYSGPHQGGVITSDGQEIPAC